MTERITPKRTDAMFAAAMGTAKMAGVDVDGWTLYRGHVVRSIVTIDPDTGAHRTIVSTIGTTEREAHAFLSAMREAWFLTLEHGRPAAGPAVEVHHADGTISDLEGRTVGPFDEEK